MKEDPDFNLLFVALVKKYPCLYDHGHEYYNYKMIQGKAWREIGRQMSTTVDESKERWKNLRASYTRHLKNLKVSSGGRLKRPYYLAEALEFLHPFTKTRSKSKNCNKISSTSSQPLEPNNYSSDDVGDAGDDSVIQEFVDNQIEDVTETKPNIQQIEDLIFNDGPANKTTKYTKYSTMNTSTITATSEELGAAALEYFKDKNLIPATTSSSALNIDHDMGFLKSILPDMIAMNNDQKRRFKIGVLKMAGEILNEPQNKRK